ncbi:DNA helicase [Tanacetum coccineum]
MFAMTSFGAKINNSVNKGRGPYVLKISSQIYHWIGSLCPEQGHHPRFLQLYIYYTHNEVENRMHHFGEVNEGTLNPDIVQGLIHVLDEHSRILPGIELKPRDGRGRGKQVSMNAYYKCQLHPRVKEFGLIFKGGRLFQQYVVAVFYAIEQSRLDFIRTHQNDLRLDYLSGLCDVISRGDHEGIAAGLKIMLPNTFTGGPR